MLTLLVVVAIIIIAFNAIKLFGEITQRRVIYTIISVAVLVALIITINRFENKGNVNEGAYYHSRCTLIEKNVNNGAFVGNTDKAICDGVITHLPSGVFERRVNDYLDSIKEARNDKDNV
ncbi:hypothetical protein AB6867_26305 [Serratia proteamaculans]|uniref:hypothetical protein n=1 Tax=Serratia proteamaculans TaxID=28151 RepID=UPI0039BE7D9C